MHVLRFLNWELSDLLMFTLVVPLHSGSILGNKDTSNSDGITNYLQWDVSNISSLAKFSGYEKFIVWTTVRFWLSKKLDSVYEGCWCSKQVNHHLYKRVIVLMSSYMFTCRNFVRIRFFQVIQSMPVILETVDVTFLNLNCSMSCCYNFLIQYENCTFFFSPKNTEL